MSEDRETISIWPHADGKWDWDMVEEFEETFDDRNQMILEGMLFRLEAEKILGDLEYWKDADADTRHRGIRQALIQYKNSE